MHDTPPLCALPPGTQLASSGCENRVCHSRAGGNPDFSFWPPALYLFSRRLTFATIPKACGFEAATLSPSILLCGSLIPIVVYLPKARPRRGWGWLLPQQKLIKKLLFFFLIFRPGKSMMIFRFSSREVI
jgi:hypothetical protein